MLSLCNLLIATNHRIQTQFHNIKKKKGQHILASTNISYLILHHVFSVQTTTNFFFFLLCPWYLLTHLVIMHFLYFSSIITFTGKITLTSLTRSNHTICYMSLQNNLSLWKLFILWHYIYLINIYLINISAF